MSICDDDDDAATCWSLPAGEARPSSSVLPFTGGVLPSGATPGLARGSAAQELDADDSSERETHVQTPRPPRGSEF